MVHTCIYTSMHDTYMHGWSTPQNYIEHEKPVGCPPLTFSLCSHGDFTMSPAEAMSKENNGRIMSSPSCPLILDGQLEQDGYSHWWAPVERMLGTLTVQGREIFLVASSPCDGGPKGRIGTIIKHTPARQRGRVADFL